MSNIIHELLSLTEKISDQNIKFENIDALNYFETFGDVGVLGASISICKLANAVQERLFSKNFQRFFLQLNVLSEEDKLKFYSKYKDKKNSDFGEQALLVLNKIEMPLAADMLGKALYLLVIDEIDDEKFHNFCHIIKNLNHFLLKHLIDIYKNDENVFSGGVYNLLASFGLLIETKKILYPGSIPPTTYYKSDFGSFFFENVVEPFA